MRFKYISLNIWGGRLLAQALGFLRQEQPDILALQEVHHNPNSSDARLNVYNQIIHGLGFAHHVFAPAFIHTTETGLTGAQGNAIFSRFPIMKSREIFFDIPFGSFREGEDDPAFVARNLLFAQIAAAGKPLSVFNVHGIWGRHGEDTDRRLKMIEQILAQIGDKPNVILSGDFNLNERIYPRDINNQPLLSAGRPTQAVVALEKRLVNVFKNERHTSFNIKRKSFDQTGYGVAVVDMVFVSPELKIVSHYQPDVDVSDHLPVVCEVEI